MEEMRDENIRRVHARAEADRFFRIMIDDRWQNAGQMNLK